MEKYQPWFLLKHVPGIGNLLFKRLIDHFGFPQNVFEASDENLSDVEGITTRLISSIRQARLPYEALREMELIEQKGYQLLFLTDPLYPPLLKEIPDPPPFLYVSGTINASENYIAVVGSRNATSYGISTTRRICSDLVEKGITIVSGMARGIDTAAHFGALMGKGRTVAVLGNGLEHIYPAENDKLFKKISENGAVISEFSLNALPDAHHFPLRNRIISGMSLGTLVVEATRRSGSLITARLAAEQNREVFAIPGSIQSFKSAGTHVLIKQGAKLVEHVHDILDELNLQGQVPDYKADTLRSPEEGTARHLLSPEEDAVLKSLGYYPVHSDELVRKLSINSGKLMAILLHLEIKGLVQHSPGNYFSLKE